MHRSSNMITIIKGQLISVLIAGTGFFASLLSSDGVSVPLLLNTINYTLLAPYLLFRRKLIGKRPGIIICCSEESDSCSQILNQPFPSCSTESDSIPNDAGSYLFRFSQLSCPWWLYAVLALVDLEANVIIVSAYRYTSVTSVMLLDCFSIPCVMILSYLFLSAKYTWTHLVGVAICLAGMGCIIISDYISSGGSCDSCSNPFYGDMLCLVSYKFVLIPLQFCNNSCSCAVQLGTSLYAISNVAQEKLVKHNDREEYLGMIGVFGVIFGVIQLLVMETRSVRNVVWSYEIIAFVIGFVLCLNIMYTRASLFLKDCDAALLNLSLLTSDVYAVIFSYLCYGYLVSWFYFLAFGLACTGLVIYSTAASPTGDKVPIGYSDCLCKDDATDATTSIDENSTSSSCVISTHPPFQASYCSLSPTDDTPA